MSQICYEPVSLADVASRSTLIVRATRIPDSQTTYPIEPTEEQTGGKPCDPYMLTSYKWEVHEVLRGQYAGDIIEVFPSDWSWSLSMHIDYYVQGLSVSPIVEEYVAEFEGPPWILFLEKGDDGKWEFSVEGSMEGIEGVDKVLPLLGKQHGEASVDRTIQPTVDSATKSRTPWTGWLFYALIVAAVGLALWQC